ncbi:glycosyltransferase family 2 protein [Arthrobacter sp. B3I4]|uniref:glycosyltransferase n=1 Tax=Arthrobacter sp. B3I4 TaxID=3042267 RepID=UPI0027800E32|nr:glycosyltransferase family 2 protein [Arthrobacter sp. B3I4]MDQ0755244.1 GT2 family glycosyltransferase [Arthrobacter sp. B3I4]
MTQRIPTQWNGAMPQRPAPGAQGPAPAPVDVLIPTCDRPAELAVTLAGLAAQSHPFFRVVVSDQSQGPAGWEHPAAAAMVRVLRAQGREVTLLQHLPRRGLAEHRQFLYEQSSADRCLFLDDDIWLEPAALATLQEALDRLDCGFVGMAPQGLSYLSDRRPGETTAFEVWDGPVRPEKIRPGTPAYDRWPLHNAANLTHLAEAIDLGPGEWLPYRVAWVGGCAMYRRAALDDAGAFRFWTELGPDHAGEDVLAQWRVMEKFGGAGILPSAAVHLESPTTVTERNVEAYDVVLGKEES